MTGSVILPLHFGMEDCPATFSLPEVVLARKAETHLTLLSTREAELLASCLPVAAWANAFDSEQWEIGLLDEFELLREERASEPTRFSAIRHARCPALNAFRQRLAKAAGMDLVETLPHVTFYTADHDRGIGLASREDHACFQVRTLTPAEWP